MLCQYIISHREYFILIFKSIIQILFNILHDLFFFQQANPTDTRLIKGVHWAAVPLNRNMFTLIVKGAVNAISGKGLQNSITSVLTRL